MSLNDFIFSNKTTNRICRHLSFWLAYFLIFFYSGIEIDNLQSFRNWEVYQHSLIRICCFAPASLLGVYIFIYFVVPHFILKQKYISFTITVVITAVLIYCIDFLLSEVWFYSEDHNQKIGIAAMSGILHFQSHFIARHIHSLYGLVQALSVIFCATAIKLAKTLYAREKENTNLAIQKKDYQMSLIRNKMQPVFLYQSLNSLYKRIHSSPDDGPTMVIQLSELFSYILYDRGNEEILLEKEINAIQNLLFVHKINNDGKTIVDLFISGDTTNKTISPAAVFSIFQLVLNSIKHANIDANIQLYESLLVLSLSFDTSEAYDIQTIQQKLMDHNIYFATTNDDSGRISVITIKIALQATIKIEKDSQFLAEAT